MMHSPTGNLLIDLYKALKSGNVPVYTVLPGAEVPEPLLVIGSHSEDDSPSGKAGYEVSTTEVQIDMYYPIDDRMALEDQIYQTKNIIKNSTDKITRVTARTIVDSSIGRDVFHVIFLVTAYI
ncbi:hypothetical protein [Periweissella fabalis]|uniref:DUF3168 domain-containing protein n=1 Tax=Periweissella fabalis TaxID=1070421 RepID=A0A7X6N2N9_9LACO|nr:hypothetical protein [Periweissella fabalis]MCM0599225.1 hypothetical protein [Periweissella fabalis]NKZ23504.1 hypothetical protein [Periweissella fabalis]